MLVQLSEDQTLFRDTAVRFIDDTAPLSKVRGLHDSPMGFERAWWAAAAELGWYGLLLPEDLGGGSVSGQGLVDAIVVAELLGRSVQPGPFTPHNVVTWTLAQSEVGSKSGALIPQLIDGSTIATWAPTDLAGNWDNGAGLQAVRTGHGGYQLAGWRGYVPEAQAADTVLVAANCEGTPVQFTVALDAPGLQLSALSCLDLSRRMAHLHFDDVTVDEEAVVTSTPSVIDGQLHHAIILTAADTVGAMGALFDMSVAYAKDRVAFGRPIGAFQAIKHLLADQALALESARAAVVAGARVVADGDEDADEVASMTAAYVSDVGAELAQEALQVHGGIGFTWEHDLHLLLRRVQANAAMYGSSSWHRERVCVFHGLSQAGAR